MARMAWMQAALPVAVALGLGAAEPRAASVGTPENTQYMAVWTDEQAHPEGSAPALLNMPPGWMTGDAAVVIAPGGPWDPGQRDLLVSALLDSGAAVLELNEPRRGPRMPAIRVDLVAAYRTMHEVYGAGLLVALGAGEGGEAALEAADTSAGEPLYAAAVRLGPGAPAFRAGVASPAEAWPLRAPLFCDLLAGVQPGGPAGFAPLCAGSLALAR